MARLSGLTDLAPLPGVAVSVAMALLVGALDVATGSELAFSIFYLAPVCLATWTSGRGAGVGLSLLDAALWSLAEARGVAHARPWVVGWNAAVHLSVFLAVAVAVDALRSALRFARTDHLTGMPNGRAFREAADGEIERARRYPRPFTIAYLDVDGFKEVNDRQGHTSGDDLLKLIALTIGTHIRRTDVAARLGGDEFALLLPETDVDAGKRTAKKVHEALSSAVSETRWSVTFSMGVVTFVRPPRAVEQALHVADTVMYNVKHAGRNRILYMTSGEAA